VNTRSKKGTKLREKGETRDLIALFVPFRALRDPLVENTFLWYDNTLAPARLCRCERIPERGERIMAVCEICGKAPMFGHNVSHSKRATNRQFKPNIQRTTILVQGKPRRAYVCAKCLKTLTKTA
jgi:large subunit ribosomal protein L28